MWVLSLNRKFEGVAKYTGQYKEYSTVKMWNYLVFSTNFSCVLYIFSTVQSGTQVWPKTSYPDIPQCRKCRIPAVCTQRLRHKLTHASVLWGITNLTCVAEIMPLWRLTESFNTNIIRNHNTVITWSIVSCSVQNF